MHNVKQGVVWISGFSASGKTTIARKLEAKLKEQGHAVILLDGDDLRSIFGGKWQYDRTARLELARIYFRLTSHLAAQGFTVIVSAVAMYAEIRQWVRDNIPGSTQIYLDVSEEERRRRDRNTKAVYQKIESSAPQYDAPDSDTVCIDNGEGISPESVVDKILSIYLMQQKMPADYGREQHWQSYYKSGTSVLDPSPFAKEVIDRIRLPARILEIGCGNGRDARFFASRGHHVTAIDSSIAAIEACKSHNSSVRFLAGTLPQLVGKLPSGFDVVYSRFVFHAMPLEEEEGVLNVVSELMETGGLLFIECRSINDSLAQQGEVISATERIYGHYRRFIVLEQLRQRVAERGFQIISAIESHGLAIHAEEDPVVIRIAAKNR